MDYYNDQNPPSTTTASGPQPLLLSVEGAADVLNISRSLTYELAARGDLRTVTIGRRRLVPIDAIAEFLTMLDAKQEANRS